MKTERVAFNSSQGIEISIPLRFNADQPRSFGVPPASAQPLRLGGFIGDTRLGGSVNAETITVTPHCNGTHTECVGHILHDRHAVIDALRDSLFPATLITVEPVPIAASGEHCKTPYLPEEKFISRAALEKSLQGCDQNFLAGLIVRTLPNDVSKCTRDYMSILPPFLSVEAAEFLARSPVKHVLLDVPSLDRADDGGLCTAHHLFWGVPEGSHEAVPGTRFDRTITELIYVPHEVRDGPYVTSIEMAPFAADAAPSRVKIFSCERICDGN